MSSRNFNAFAFSFIGKYLNIIVQLVAVIVLARMLTPEDYGLYSITFIFTLFASLLKEFGVSGYIIKENNLTKDKLAGCFCLLLIAGFSAALALHLLASPIAKIYEKEALTPMLQLLSLNVALSPFGTIVACVLRRDMKFLPLTLSDVSSSVLSVLVMIVLAHYGYGAMTLVYGALVTTISKTLLLQAFRPKIVPLLPSVTHLGEVFRYSKYSSTSNIVGQIGNYSSELIVGKLYSMETVGILSKANSLVAMFNKFFYDALAQVVAPFIAEVKRTQDSELAGKINLITNVQLNFAWPFLLILALLSDPIIFIMLGEQWDEVQNILIILCISRMGFSVFQHVNPILMGLGQAKAIMKIELTSNIVRILVLLTTSGFGINVMLISVAVINNVLRVFMFLPLIEKELHVHKSQYIAWLLKPALSTLLTILPIVIVSIYSKMNWQENIPLYTLAIIVTALLWLVLLKRQPASVILNSIQYKLIKLRG